MTLPYAYQTSTLEAPLTRERKRKLGNLQNMEKEFRELLQLRCLHVIFPTV